MSARTALLECLAQRLVALEGDRLIIAVDGVDGSGKTTFADELVPFVQALGRSVVRASVDGFHNPASLRYRRGRHSPEGFFLDSYNYYSLRQELLLPFRSGARSVQTARFDYRRDQEVSFEWVEPTPSSMLLIDGIFLHRDELLEHWDFSVFLDVPFAISYRRMADRDGSNPDPEAPGNHRYLQGQKIYLQSCCPHERATTLIDNSDLQAPWIVRG